MLVVSIDFFLPLMSAFILFTLDLTESGYLNMGSGSLILTLCENKLRSISEFDLFDLSSELTPAYGLST